MLCLQKKTLAAVTAAGIAAGALAGVGLADAASAASTNLFAKIDANGSVIAGNGVASATQYGPGRYEVTFSQNVSACAYVATTKNAYSQAVQVFTAGGHASAQGVYVETKNQGGGLTSAPFDLAVDCGAPGTGFAVVGYNADLVRASYGVAMTHLSTGRYDVTFPMQVKTCAFVATVADPGSNLVYSPAGVYTGSGPDASTVYLETKNTGGGLTDGVPFHLAVLCPSAAKITEAVVGASGLTTRGSAGAATFAASTGQYDLVMRADVTRCAVIATRGSTDRNVPYTPSTVETVPGPAGNTVGLQVRSLLFFGGSLDSQSFHAAVVC
jgi:hypothetical protein